ncbi:hypothetical protein NDU88_007198 [Pleurodeles waltl]|uniref:Uncharacterized protein n=1 Tax=Pleurodeles waltl TaxID=8319 RepID=A0AAV7NW30_PLEWA|nr:hypothetical protein NDU88_007198 [Pleurodeles waltl]
MGLRSSRNSRKALSALRGINNVSMLVRVPVPIAGHAESMLGHQQLYHMGLCSNRNSRKCLRTCCGINSSAMRVRVPVALAGRA